MIPRSSQDGFALIAAVILILLVSFLGLAFSYFVVDDATSGAEHAQSSQALFVAESGIQRGMRALQSPTLALC